VEKQRIGCQRLAAILRAKTEKDDLSFAQSDFDQCRFSLDTISAEQPA